MSISAHHRRGTIAIVNDVSVAREVAAKVFRVYGDLPAYRAMLDRGDAAEPVDVALVGDPATIKDEIRRLEDLGVTDLSAFVFGAESGAFERTIDFLGFVMNDAERMERAPLHALERGPVRSSAQ